MTWWLLVGATAITVASRLLPMTLLPTPTGRSREVLEALPAPLFAVLAVVALVGNGHRPDPPALLAVAGALLGATRQNLATTLLGGIGGFVAGRLLFA